MSQNNGESYDFEIPEEGLDYDLLDLAFNPHTQRFIEINGIQPGMKVLDIGSGSGVMTHYLARQVGPNGHVLSIDNSENQLIRAKKHCDRLGDENITFKLISAYDLADLNLNFDFIYCRFVLHHLHSPKLAIELFYQYLNAGGIYVAEEGIISSAFSYPPSLAWSYGRQPQTSPEVELEGLNRDGDFGIKLFYWMKKSGFTIRDTKLIQPVLTRREDKENLLLGHIAYKKTALEQGKSEQDWELEKRELIRLANDDFSIIGFYQSCQVCGVK